MEKLIWSSRIRGYMDCHYCGHTITEGVIKSDIIIANCTHCNIRNILCRHCHRLLGEKPVCRCKS